MEHPGQVLKKRFLDPLGVTPYQLAKGTGVQQTRVSEIIHGRRRISAATAVRFGAFFGVPPRWFARLQMEWDLARAASHAEGIERLQGRYWVRPSGAQKLGPVPSARPTTHDVDRQFRDRVHAQATLGQARVRREVAAVEYDNGMKAIVGADEGFS